MAPELPFDASRITSPLAANALSQVQSMPWDTERPPPAPAKPHLRALHAQKSGITAVSPRKASPWVRVFSRVVSPEAFWGLDLPRKERLKSIPKALTASIGRRPGHFYVQPGCPARLVPQNLTFRRPVLCKQLLNPLTHCPAGPHHGPRTPSLDYPASPHQDSRKASPDLAETLAW